MMCDEMITMIVKDAMILMMLTVQVIIIAALVGLLLSLLRILGESNTNEL